MNSHEDEKTNVETDEGDTTIGSAGAAPNRVYFYYIEKTDDYGPVATDDRHDGWQLRAYVEKRKADGELDEQEILELLADADGGRIEIKGKKMQEVILRYRAFMIFVWKEGGRSLENVRFVSLDDPSQENHSFKDFSRMSLSADLSVVACVNIRKDRHGGPLGNKSESFSVVFETNPKLPRPIHDETTTNTGP